MLAMWLGLALVVSGAACGPAERMPQVAALDANPSDLEPGDAQSAPAVKPGPRTCAAAPEPLAAPSGEDPILDALSHYARGRILMGDQNHIQAAKELRQAADLAPEVQRIRLYLGLALYDSGNVAAALEALDVALRMDPKDPMTLFYRARVAGSQGDQKTSLDLLKRLVAAAPKKSPFRILGLYYQAKAYQEQGEADAAIVAYEELLPLLAEPESFFQRYPEIFLIYRGQVQLKETLGRLYLLQGNAVKAIALLTEALEDRPDHAETAVLLVRAYVQRKDYAKAREWARKLIEGQPDGGPGYQVLAEVYTAEGKPKDVIADLEKYRQAYPRSRALATQLAQSYEAAGRKDDAVALYRELAVGGATVSQGSEVAAALKLADLLAKDGKPVDALEVLGNAMKGDVAETSLLVRAAQMLDGLKERAKVYQDAQRLVSESQKNYGPFVLVGMLAETVGKRDEALALYDKALDRQPKAALACSRKADLLIEAGKLPEALAAYQACLKAGVEVPMFHRKMGMILERLDRMPEALAEYRLARQSAPDDKPTRYLLSGLLARMGQFDEAEKELRNFLARFPGEIQGYCQLAGVYMSKGDLDAAEKAVGQAQAIDGSAVMPQAVLAEIRYRQKQFVETEQMARAVLARESGDTEVRMLLAYALAAQKKPKEAEAEIRAVLAAEPENLSRRYVLAGLYAEMGDTASAERELQRILQKKPDHAPANNDLGYMWADRGVNLPEAERMILAALKSAPDSPAYLDSLGWLMYKTGRFEEAIKALQQATEKAPELDAVLWDHLGDAYWRASRPQDASKAWEAAAKILQSSKSEAKPEDLDRVQKKARSVQLGSTPGVAPIAAPAPDTGKNEPKSPSAPQP